jgi:outer membrane immunogenic protein
MRQLIFTGLFVLLSLTGLAAQNYKDTAAPNIWQGPYAGVNVGGLFDYHDITGSGVAISSIGTNGWMGGVTGGYDLALHNYLIGAWADYNLEEGSAQILGARVKALDNWGVGLKLGYVVIPNVLAYGKVGFAVDSFSTNVPGAKLSTLTGISYGGGLEYALTNNLFMHTEYRHEDYNGAAFTSFARDNLNDNRVTAGISWKFNTFVSSAPLSLAPPAPTYTPLK